MINISKYRSMQNGAVEDDRPVVITNYPEETFNLEANKNLCFLIFEAPIHSPEEDRPGQQ